MYGKGFLPLFCVRLFNLFIKIYRKEKEKMKRIISLILVVVMSALALVGCGYSYAEDDLTQYVTFDKAAFEAALKAIQIEDGDFTMDEDTRAKEVLDYINEALAKKADTADKKYTGVAIPSTTDLNNNKIYYCYYVTTTAKDKDNNDVAITVYASSMKESSAIGIQVGLSDLDDVSKKVEDAFAGLDFENNVYETKTSGTVEENKTAYITYTVEYKGAEGTVKETHTNVKVVVADNAAVNGIHNFVAQQLKTKSINTTLSDTFVENEADENAKRTYSGVKVDWVVEKEGVEKTFTHTYTETKNVTATNGNKYDLKDLELTYHVYPVYYLEVEDLSANAIVKTLSTASAILSGIKAAAEDTETAEEDKVYFRTLKDCVALLEAYVELEKKVTEAETAKKTAKESEDKLKEAYDKTVTATADAKTALDAATDANRADLQAKYDAAVSNEASAKTAYDAAVAATAEKQTALDTAEADADAKLAEVYAAANKGEAATGEEAIINEYKKMTYDNLLATYNNEIKMALAKEIWAAMKSSTTNLKDDEGRNLHPRKAVREVYDRLYENYEYTFYTGTESTSKQTYYKYYNGRFEEFLKKQTGTDSFQNAKDAVWADAEKYVESILVVYTVSNAYGKTLDKKAIKEYKKDPMGDYSSNEYYYGETNAIVAYQFDTLLNFFLENTEDEKGEINFTNALLPTREEYIKKEA